MTLEQFVEKLKPMLKNPNAITSGDSVIYAYTSDREFIALETGPKGRNTQFA
jgi:hypothetical protein